MDSYIKAFHLFPITIPATVFAHHTLLLVAAIISCLVFANIKIFSKHQRLISGIPIVGGDSQQDIKNSRIRFIHDGKAMLEEGYKKYGGDFFYVPSVLGERLMIPVKYLEDLKAAPMDQVDFVATFFEMFEGKYTTMGSRSTLHPRVVKAQLNHNLPAVMPAIQEEIQDAFDANFPPCEDWTEINVVDIMIKIVARVSSRMFGGTELSRNQEWIDASIAFAIDGFHGAQKLKRFPEFLKPIAKYFIPEISAIRNHYRAAEKAAIPLLNRREKTGETALDLLYWMSEQAKGSERDKKFLASILLKVSFAAIHTSAAAPSQLIYDLCEMPQYIQPLREEIDSVTEADGQIGKKGFLRMPKMDSIMKESQRFNPLLLITFERVITTPFHLSNNLIIPPHTTIGIPAASISMDPTLYPDPTTYTPFRFADIRATDPAQEGKAQYVASNPSSMAFGYGRHACPGRFFASNEIKAIMAHLLRGYDMKFREGEGRPKSLLFETQFLPNPGGVVLFRRRGV